MVLWTTFWVLLAARVLWECYAPAGGPGQTGPPFWPPWLRNVLLLVPAAFAGMTIALFFSARQSTLRIWLRLRVMRRRWRVRDPHIALFLALCAVCMCVGINLAAFRGQVMIQDDTNYLFQAKIFSHARLWADPPPDGTEDFFRFPYMVISEGKWFSSFFPGQSLALLGGVLIGGPFVVNPILTGILLWLTYWAGGRMFDRTGGLFAAALMVVSPWVLLQGASFMSHVTAAVFSTVAATWILTAEGSRRWSFLGTGAALGFLLLTRPFSAALLATYGLIWALWLWWRRQRTVRDIASQILLATLGFTPFALVLLFYDRALTGHLLVTPHHVALRNEHLGIGMHSLRSLEVNGFSLSQYLFGIPGLSLLPLGVYAVWHRDRWFWPLIGLLGVFALGYSLYPYHGAYLGPRFYYDIAPFLFIASARGLVGISRGLAHFLGARRGVHSVASWCAIQGVVALIGFLHPYLLQTYRLATYLEIEGLVHEAVQPSAVVFITDPASDSYVSYLAGFRLNRADLDGPVLYARDLGGRNSTLVRAFPERRFYCLDMRARTIVSCERHQTGQSKFGPGRPSLFLVHCFGRAG